MVSGDGSIDLDEFATHFLPLIQFQIEELTANGRHDRATEEVRRTQRGKRKAQETRRVSLDARVHPHLSLERGVSTIHELEEWAHRPHIDCYVSHTLTSAGTGENAGKTALTPFVAHSTTQFIIRGELDATMCTEMLAKENLYPILSPNGRAIGNIVINTLRSSVVDHPYNEIMFTVDASKKPNLHAAGWDNADDPFGAAYAIFQTTPSHTMFLHTLYVDSSFACDASRQTQAFPKHTIIPTIDYDESSTAINIKVSFEDDLLFKAHIQNCWPSLCGLCCGRGLCMLMRVFFNYSYNFGLCRVLGALMSTCLDFEMAMPKACAKHTKKPRSYQGRVKKGLKPWAVRAWPFTEDSTVEFGDKRLRDVGIEENNGHRFFSTACFIPLLVEHIPESAFCVNSRPHIDRELVTNN